MFVCFLTMPLYLSEIVWSVLTESTLGQPVALWDAWWSFWSLANTQGLISEYLRLWDVDLILFLVNSVFWRSSNNTGVLSFIIKMPETKTSKLDRHTIKEAANWIRGSGCEWENMPSSQWNHRVSFCCHCAAAPWGWRHQQSAKSWGWHNGSFWNHMRLYTWAGSYSLIHQIINQNLQVMLKENYWLLINCQKNIGKIIITIISISISMRG